MFADTVQTYNLFCQKNHTILKIRNIRIVPHVTDIRWPYYEIILDR